MVDGWHRVYACQTDQMKVGRYTVASVPPLLGVHTIKTQLTGPIGLRSRQTPPLEKCWVFGQTCPCPKPQLCSPRALLVVNFYADLLFFLSLPDSSPLLGQTTHQQTHTRVVVVVGLLRNQPQLASPGRRRQTSRTRTRRGPFFPFFCPHPLFSCLSRVCFLTGRAIRYFTSLLYPKLLWFLHITDPPHLLVFWIACRLCLCLCLSVNKQPCTCSSPCPWRGEAGASFLGLSQFQTRGANNLPRRTEQSSFVLPSPVGSATKAHTRTHARRTTSRSPSKFIPSQNRRFPLFRLITIIITSNPNAAHTPAIHS